MCLPWRGFNPLPVIKPGVTHQSVPREPQPRGFNPLPVIKPGVTGIKGIHPTTFFVSIHSRLLSRELRLSGDVQNHLTRFQSTPGY
ncbi:protein of unknown function [Methylocaldum szegediense]|uniref:Uncharacterized protein n=1 Tax=Methylocaldum szegediense TaxID=73780 RepID=A0ABN8XE33_9GAMM|nr:protein of unknown function [Methylocaldum szegediense]